MNIGIIGAGNVGGTLARKLTQLGHRVSVANSRGPKALAALAAEIGAIAATVVDAVRDADLVIVAVPEKSIPSLQRGLFRAMSESAVIVDAGNYFPQRDGTIDALDGDTTESQWVSRHLGRTVVKAFNNITARSLAECGRARGTLGRIALPIAGDDDRGKRLVIELVDALGFDAVDAGTLGQSWRQQPGTPVYCTDLDAEHVRRALWEADRARAPELRDVRMRKKMEELAAATKSPRDR